MRFRKKPVEVDAIRFTGLNYDEVCEFVGEPVPTDPQRLTIRTLEGDIFASPGDWIVRGTRGEYYPCKPEPFADTFDRVDDDPTIP